jgi:hypothetical protein
MIQKNTDFSYLAGYLDGDGCFYIGYDKSTKRIQRKKVTCIIINSVNECTLKSFKKIFGGSIQLSKKSHDNKKSLFRYTLRKRNILAFIEKVIPFLVEKKEECEVALKFSKTDCKILEQELLNRMSILKDVSNLASKYHKKEFEKSRNTILPTKEDYAYLAGFIDAECCLGIQKYKPKDKPNNIYKILLQCNNTKAPVFKWLLERFGGVIHFVNRLTHQKARKNQLTWRLSARELYRLLPNILPFLRYKKPVCEELMKFYETTLPNGGARHTDEFRTHYESVLKIREDIVTKVHLLNLKGNSIISG